MDQGHKPSARLLAAVLSAWEKAAPRESRTHCLVLCLTWTPKGWQWWKRWRVKTLVRKLRVHLAEEYREQVFGPLPPVMDADVGNWLGILDHHFEDCCPAWLRTTAERLRRTFPAKGLPHGELRSRLIPDENTRSRRPRPSP